MQRLSGQRRPAGQGKKLKLMQNANNGSAAAKKNNNASAAKQQVSNRRVVETRDLWERIFAHTVTLVVAQVRGQQVADPRKGYGFGAVATQPHSRAYAQSLLTGFTTCKAGRVLAGNDDLADKANRVKIATAILLATKLAKDGNEGAARIMAKSEPKREKAFAQAVLAELAKPVTLEEGKAEKPKADEKPATPKGGKASAKPKATPKGGKGKKAAAK